MLIVGMNAVGLAPEFEPVEVPTTDAALVTLTEQLRHDAPGHPVDQLTAADVEHGYQVTVAGTEYWVTRR